MDAKTAKQLDKFYTKPEIAKLCYRKLSRLMTELGLQNEQFIEPSAGSGVFLDVVQRPCIGFDIHPEDERVQLQNFLDDGLPLPADKNLVFIGNPPFGKKGALAVKFLNKALSLGVAVGFIVPIQFRKWSIQSQIADDAKLLSDLTLPENSFTFMGKDYDLRCCFQVWAVQSLLNPLNLLNHRDFRQRSSPPIQHPDFLMYQYNRTKEAEKFFRYDWDFAILRQGYGDYTKLWLKGNKLRHSKQWIFFKAKDERILQRLKSINFDELSKKNTSTPGFGKADVVAAYGKLVREAHGQA